MIFINFIINSSKLEPALDLMIQIKLTLISV